MRAPTKFRRSIGPEDADSPGRRFTVSEARVVAVGGSSGLDDWLLVHRVLDSESDSQLRAAVHPVVPTGSLGAVLAGRRCDT
jgi:hypothetical protein